VSSDDDNRFTVVQGGSASLEWYGGKRGRPNPANFDASISWGNGEWRPNWLRRWSSDDGVDPSLRWLGTPDSVADISKPVTDRSGCERVSWQSVWGQTAGYSTVLGSRQCDDLEWGRLSTAVDIHPSAFYQSCPKATNGVTQVGFGVTEAGSDLRTDFSSSTRSLDRHRQTASSTCTSPSARLAKQRPQRLETTAPSSQTAFTISRATRRARARSPSTGHANHPYGPWFRSDPPKGTCGGSQASTNHRSCRLQATAPQTPVIGTVTLIESRARVARW